MKYPTPVIPDAALLVIPGEPTCETRDPEIKSVLVARGPGSSALCAFGRDDKSGKFARDNKRGNG